MSDAAETWAPARRGRPGYDQATVLRRAIELFITKSELEVAALKRRPQISDKLAILVQAAGDEGALRDDISPDVISRLLFGTVNSLVEWNHPDGPVEAVTLARCVASMAFDGLAKS